jgi:hypothetical protein
MATKLAANLRHAMRGGRKHNAIYDVTKKHSFSPIPVVAIERQPLGIQRIKTIYNVQVNPLNSTDSSSCHAARWSSG